MKELGFIVKDTQFSKKISQSKSGMIIKKQNKLMFLVTYPSFSEKEQKLRLKKIFIFC